MACVHKHIENRGGDAREQGENGDQPKFTLKNSYKILIFDFPLTRSRFAKNQDLLLCILGLSQSDQR